MWEPHSPALDSSGEISHEASRNPENSPDDADWYGDTRFLRVPCFPCHNHKI